MAKRHMKRHSALLIAKEMQINTTMNLTLVRMVSSKSLQIINAGKGL